MRSVPADLYKCYSKGPSRGSAWIELRSEYVFIWIFIQSPGILAGHENINRELVHRGYAVFREDLGGAEQQAMHGWLSRLFGHYAEEMFFAGDQHFLNPMRYLPTPFHTKYAQQRTPLSQYIQQEAVGMRMCRWNRPLHDFLLPYLRGVIVARVTGQDAIPGEHRQDLDRRTERAKSLATTPSLRAAFQP